MNLEIMRWFLSTSPEANSSPTKWLQLCQIANGCWQRGQPVPMQQKFPWRLLEEAKKNGSGDILVVNGIDNDVKPLCQKYN